jgi:phycoerythrin-associated linker protein
MVSISPAKPNQYSTQFFGEVWCEWKDKKVEAAMLPPEAEKKMQQWIRSRHLICSGNFFVFQTVDAAALDRFSDCIAALGGTIISVEPMGKIWMGAHRQVILHQAKASLHTPCHDLKRYWIKYGGFHTRFDDQS